MNPIDSKRHIVIHPRGRKPPLFWVQTALEQTSVLQEFDRDQPVYCLYRLQPLPNGRPLRFEEIAAYHIDTVRSLCPRGPYALVGYCVCATIVFEMALQLHDQGETISTLILIDPLDPAISRARLIQESPLFRLGFQFNRVLYHLREIRSYSAKDKLAYCMESARAMKTRLKRSLTWRFSSAVSHTARALPQHTLLDVHESDMYAVRNYLPRPYSGSAIVLRPSLSVPRAYEYPNRRWLQLISGGVDVQNVPGDSDSMWRMPNARTLSQSILSCMAESRGLCSLEAAPKADSRGRIPSSFRDLRSR